MNEWLFLLLDDQHQFPAVNLQITAGRGNPAIYE